jgi:hypothetical protein
VLGASSLSTVSALAGTLCLRQAGDCEEIKTELVHHLKEEFGKANQQTDFQHLFIEPLIKLINSSHI